MKWNRLWVSRPCLRDMLHKNYCSQIANLVPLASVSAAAAAAVVASAAGAVIAAAAARLRPRRPPLPWPAWSKKGSGAGGRRCCASPRWRSRQPGRGFHQEKKEFRIYLKGNRKSCLTLATSPCDRCPADLLSASPLEKEELPLPLAEAGAALNSSSLEAFIDLRVDVEW